MGELSQQKQVHRAGDAVVRPATPWTASVHTLLRHLEAVCFAGAPRVVGSGLDSDGRETLTFIPGDVGPTRTWSDDGIHELGRLLRRLHLVTASFQPPSGAIWQDSFLRSTAPDAIVSHGDAAPWNVVAHEGRPIALIDWELAGPVDRLSEVAHTGWLNAQLHDDDIAARQGLSPAPDRIRHLRLFTDGYGLPAWDRAKLVTRIIDVALLSCASDAIETKITSESSTADPLIWGVAWRARSAAWLVRHRTELERAVR
ncbi:MAG: phosphotransferase [Chloroflexia bacterium]|nr:phosphotransferase [Chloroflexia bacterium]